MIKKSIMIVLIIFNCVTGFFTYLYFSREPEIKIVEKTKIEYEKVYRDYTKLSNGECVKELTKYDTSVPMLDGHIEDKNIFYAEAGLNERTWNRKFKLKIAESGNWKFYIGAGIVGVAVGSFIVYKIK